MSAPAVLDDALRRDDVADRFRHLAPVLVEHEAVGQYRVVGRAAARAAALQQRGVEPAAMLVGPFEIHDLVAAAVAQPADAGEAGKLFGILQREGVGRARVEPDVEDVVDLAPVLARPLPQEALARTGRVPGVGALLREGGEDARVDGLVDQRPVLGIDEDGDRHAPRRAGARPPSPAGWRSCR